MIGITGLTDRLRPERLFGFAGIRTLRHCSWLNQVEIWFPILVRCLRKRASFSSLEDLRTRVRNFNRYFNEVLGKSFRWLYTGRPL